MREDVIAAAHALAAAGLVTAFGHVSYRDGQGSFRITPPKPLGALKLYESLSQVSLAED